MWLELVDGDGQMCRDSGRRRIAAGDNGGLSVLIVERTPGMVDDGGVILFL
jgi:hypothetical protein